MARVSIPLLIPDEDLKILEHRKAFGSKEESLRAEIVLACSTGKAIKEIAGELNTSEVTIRKWRNAYKTDGLPGLDVVHTGGRKPKSDKIKDLEKHILKILEWESENNITVRDIANELSVPENMIYYILNKNGITLSRNRSWSYCSRDDMGIWDPPVTGIYLSASCNAIIAATKAYTGADDEMGGILKTYHRPFKKELDKSVVPVGLIGLLNTAITISNNGVTVPTKIPTCESVIEESLKAWNGMDVEFYIFTSGSQVVYEGPLCRQCHIVSCGSISEMKDAFLHWMGGRCNATQHSKAEVLARAINKLAVSLTETSYPFVWMLERRSVVNEDLGAEGIPSEENHEMSDVAIPLPAGEWESIEQMLTETLPEMDNQAPCTETGVIIYQRSEDGEIQVRVVPSKQKFQSLKDFDFHSKDGFERDLSRLEIDTEALLSQTRTANYAMYLDFVKKNKS